MVSWLALSAGGGNVGLQRSVAAGPTTLGERPLAIVFVAIVSLIAALTITIVARSMRSGPLLLSVLAWDVVGAAVLAPLAIGELEPFHSPVVFVVLTVVGVQPLEALVGSGIGQRISTGTAPAA